MADTFPHLAYSNDKFPTVGKGFTPGGGGGMDGEMEARVTALEKSFEKIDGKLDAIRADVSEMKGRLSQMPSAESLGHLKGRIDALPTTTKMAGLITIAVAVLGILNNWTAIKAMILG